MTGPIRMTPELAETLTPEQVRFVEQYAGQCIACLIAETGYCEHMGERARDRELDHMRIRPVELLQHTMSIAAAGFPPENFSPIEVKLLAAFHDAKLYPELQYRIGRYYADFAFPESRWVVEADGKEFHDPESDRQRDRDIRAAGWNVKRFPGWLINRDAAACVDEIWYQVV